MAFLFIDSAQYFIPTQVWAVWKSKTTLSLNSDSFAIHPNTNHSKTPSVHSCCYHQTIFDVCTHSTTYAVKRITIPPVSYPSILTRAGMPPDLKIARSPSRWWERLCKVPAEQRAVSTSPVFCIARTTAETICGERIRAWRDASFFDNWCTITAALFTTT